MDARRASFSPTLALLLALALAAFLIVMSALLLVVHPHGTGVLASSVVGQNQGAKNILYVGAFVVLLPVSLLGASRLADGLAAGPAAGSLPSVVALVSGSLSATLVFVRVSGPLPWGNGLGALLGFTLAWALLAGAALGCLLRGTPWPGLGTLERHPEASWIATAGLLLAVLVCLTGVGSLNLLVVVLGVLAALVVVLLYTRVRLPRVPRPAGLTCDLVVIALLILAIPNVIVFRASGSIPNVYFEPGIIQFHQDFLLGPANQLLGGGALLVNVPVSQYGVGFIYFLAGWFHLVPIGYGTYGFLDGLVTAGFYVAGWWLLRAAGVGRLLAASGLALAVLTFIYNLHYEVGALPQQGPLRFGLPMAVVLASAIAEAHPNRARWLRTGALVAVAVSAVWSLEAFGYTAFTFAALAVVRSWLAPPGERRRLLLGELGRGVAACIAGQLVLALATLAGTGQLPDWGQYAAYVNALLLGGKAAQISYAFQSWSPALALGAVAFASAAAIGLLAGRAPAVLAADRPKTIALVGVTAYAVALFSYTADRSSTYLLPYVALPTLLAVVLWLSLALSPARVSDARIRIGALALALGVAVLMLAAAWPSIRGDFDDSALAHTYPGGGLGAAIKRLWHPPPIDPRAPEGQRLLGRYIPGSRAIVLLPTEPDLGTEILIRSRRANEFFIGDPKADALVPASEWRGTIARQIRALHPGERLLTDTTGLRIAAQLRGRPAGYPLAHPLEDGNTQLEWILRQLDARFVLRPVLAGSDGFVVAALSARS